MTVFSIWLTYEPKGDMFQIDALLFKAVGKSSDGSGFGSNRDHNFSTDSKREAEELAEKIGEFFSKKSISYSIDIEAA